MIRLFQGSGALDFKLEGGPADPASWEKLRRSALQLLEAREQTRAATLLSCHEFALYEGTNGFADDFSVLYLRASIEEYVEIQKDRHPETARAYRTIAEVVTEIGPYIRFIAVELDTKSSVGIPAVAQPVLATTSDAVERALVDCELLILKSGATSGVDRVHTAFHGYLRAVCSKNRIDTPDDASITQLFKALRKEHTGFTNLSPRSGDIDRVIQHMAGIVDALNPIRNNASLAHANEALLDEAEAMLAINGVRTLLHYVNAKVE